MFDPEWDLNYLWKTLANDEDVLAAMGLTGADNLTKAKHIIKKSKYSDLADGEKRLCIYFRPSRINPLSIITEEVVQIDAHVPEDDSMDAYEIQKAVLYALKDKKVNGRRMIFDGQLGELATAPGYFCVGSRFKYYGTI